MNSKKTARIRRSAKTRFKIRDAGAVRLCVHRTPRHMYAQIIDASGSNVIVAASTVEADVKAGMKATGNVDAAKLIGALIAKRALEKGVSAVAFDRAGFKYHGRVKALADAARESGLQF